MIETKFKNSEVGLIPEDWVSAPLSSIGEVKMCKRILKEQTTESGDVPFYKIGTFGKEPDAFIPRSLYEQFKSAYPYPKKGTILISAAGTIGRTVVFDGADAYFQDSNIVWIDHKEDKVKNSYLEHYFKVINWKSENGGTISRLYNDNLRSTFLCYPKDKDEQSRIATALSDVDELIETLNKLIEKKRNIMQGARQELLSGKRRLSGFTDKWAEITIGQLCKPYKGSQINKNDLELSTGYPVMNGGITPSGFHHDFNEPANTIIMSEGGNSCGFVSFMKTPFWAGGHCYVLRPQEPINLDYLYHVLKYYEPSIMDLRTGSGLPNVKKSSLNDFELSISQDKDEQLAIANVLSDMDSEITMLESRLTKYQSMKQGMMQQLLTGKIRLI